MELFLNLCWLALLLPAYTLWQHRTSSDRSARGSLIFICTLGCVLVLLFPVISASDDLHAISQAMEESKRSFHHADHRACGSHSTGHFAQAVLAVSASANVAFEQVGTILLRSPHSPGTVSITRSTGRAPPTQYPTSL